MTYKKHHDDLQKMLTEFERVTGTGSMKTANQAMIKIIRSLVAMVETLVPDEAPSFSPAQTTSNVPVTTGCGGSCGGNCTCNTPSMVTPVTVPFTVIKPEAPVEPEVVVPAKSEAVAVQDPAPEPEPEPIVEPAEAVEKNHPAEPATEHDNGSEDTAKPAKKAKKPPSP